MTPSDKPTDAELLEIAPVEGMRCKLSTAELVDLHGRFISCNDGFADPPDLPRASAGEAQ